MAKVLLPRLRDRSRARVIIDLCHDTIIDRLPDYVAALSDLALGAYVEKTLIDGTTRVYRERPDKEAAFYLIDRVLGKPKERVELGGSGDFDSFEDMILARAKERFTVTVTREDGTTQPVEFSLPERSPQTYTEETA